MNPNSQETISQAVAAEREAIIAIVESVDEGNYYTDENGEVSYVGSVERTKAAIVAKIRARVDGATIP